MSRSNTARPGVVSALAIFQVLIAMSADAAPFTAGRSGPFCPPVTEYAEEWTSSEEDPLPMVLYAYGSVETCGTSSPVDMLLELRHESTLLDYEWAWGYSFVDAYAETELDESSPEGAYGANVQAWLDEEHYACYDFVSFVTIFNANYQLVKALGGGKGAYSRCDLGSCLNLTVSTGYSSPPAYIRLGVLRVSTGYTALCFAAGSGVSIPNCSA